MNALSGFVAAGNQVIAPGPYAVADLTFTDTSGALNTISVYDTGRVDGGATPYGPNIGSYTGASLTPGTLTVNYTDFNGNAQSYTDPILERDNDVTVAAQTNPAAKKLITLAVAANATVTYTPPNTVGFSNGIMIRATAAAAYTVTLAQLP